MKRIIALALALCMMVGSVAVAQSEAPYVPGARTQELLMSALNAGLIVSCDLNVSIDMNPTLLTDDPNEAALIAAIFETIANAHLHMGAGKTQDGLRVEIGASLDPADPASGAAPASVSFAANVDWDSVSIESDLLPGQRITMQWETLLMLAGADQETIEMFKALRDVDLNEVVSDLIAELEAQLAAAGSALVPYADICVNHFATWAAESYTDVPATDRYPAAAEVVVVTITTHDIASLLSDLIDQAERDGLFDNDDLRAQVAELRDNLVQLDSVDGVFTLRIGAGADGMPAYITVHEGDDEDKASAVFSLVLTPMSEEETGAEAYDVSLLVYTRDGNMLVDDQFAMRMIVAVDPSDPVLAASAGVQMAMDASTYGETFYAIDYTVTTVGETTAAGLPGARTQLSETIVSDLDYTVMRTVATADGLTALTAAGGEGTTMTGSVEVYAGNEALVSMPIASAIAYAPDGQGGVTGEGVVTAGIPELGIDEIAYTLRVSSKAYDPASTAALEEIALEEITDAQFDALGESLQANFMGKVFAFMALMPQSVMSLLLAE